MGKHYLKHTQVNRSFEIMNKRISLNEEESGNSWFPVPSSGSRNKRNKRVIFSKQSRQFLVIATAGQGLPRSKWQPAALRTEWIVALLTRGRAAALTTNWRSKLLFDLLGLVYLFYYDYWLYLNEPISKYR